MPIVKTKGLLFDMDGTLVDSTPGVIQAWNDFGKRYGFDGNAVADATHGARLVDSLKRYCHITDEAELHAEVQRFETDVLEATRRGQGVSLLPGVLDLLGAVSSVQHDRPIWAIVTSATSLYAPKALEAAGVPMPEKLITADRVTHGKPHPEPYLAGAAACELEAKDCIVVEDAPNGIKAAQAAGSRVLAVCTSHSRAQLEGSKPDWIITRLTGVKASWDGEDIVLEIDETP
ncbi:glycerol-1-phosphatase [Dacryopinax primogenitus]|uniref:Glycerol-1-phosphatase n=1 Tax=Dacryopinax primogenitus (strain DJM 731) TaxID=1858805 RepID=M5FWW6_DACPD|nr:glycerol-1-phosphatase [Dacryopinax primogenitus]EJU00909.1 glycerol-1-phosphatase [Dacryopinax primogenitus]